MVMSPPNSYTSHHAQTRIIAPTANMRGSIIPENNPDPAKKLMSDSQSVVGIILAGGLAKRMGGGDKCLLPLAGKTLLQRTVERAQPQVGSLLLNANGNS